MSGPKEKLFLRSHFCFGKNAAPLFMIVSEIRRPLRPCPEEGLFSAIRILFRKRAPGCPLYTKLPFRGQKRSD